MSTRKQSLTHEDFLRMKEQAAGFSRAYTEDLISGLLAGIDAFRKDTGRRSLAYGWSGGKDSLALQYIYICEQAGINHCVLGRTDLEYPAFLHWMEQHRPAGLSVINTGQDLDWLAAHPHMLFPQDSNTAAKWFSGVQHKAQRIYYTTAGLDALLLGRRLQDGNYVGTGGRNWYAKDGVVRFSPIHRTTHQDIFAIIAYAGLSEPPIYSWPRGYRCGTHSWAARQWCKSEQHGWGEIYQIDPSIVHQAAAKLPGAQTFLQNLSS